MNIWLAYRGFLQIRTAYFKTACIMQSQEINISVECEIRGCWKRAATTKIQYPEQGWPEVGGPPSAKRVQEMKVTIGNLRYDQKPNYKIIRASFGGMLVWTERGIPFCIGY